MALITGVLILARHSIHTSPGNVYKQIVNWLPLFAHLTLLLIYSATVFYIWQAHAHVAEALRRVTRRSRGAPTTRPAALNGVGTAATASVVSPPSMNRFRIPLLRLTINVANLFLFNMPLVLLEIVVTVKQWTPFRYYACASMMHPHGMDALTTLIYALAYQRVLNDVIIGFATDKQVGVDPAHTCSDEMRSVGWFRSGSPYYPSLHWRSGGTR